MREDLDKKLCEAFPNLYADRHKPMNETAMCWGFQMSDGWFKIIWALSKKLEAMILKQPEDKRTWFKASTVKEKFGGLRFYMTSETDEMAKAIRTAERKSYKTCEMCGKPGKPNPVGWISTLCVGCRRKENKRMGKTPAAPYSQKKD